ncbi:MAG: hypothetical protein HQ471_07695 [Flavobacteriales bacterium]|nr:hypothetical protein [Flavobacteriales bacterium]
MGIFDLNFPSKKDEEKFEKLGDWFDFMNKQFEKIEESDRKYKINNLLIDNDIDSID